MVTMALIQGVLNTFVIVLARVVGRVIDSYLSGNREGGPGLGYFAIVFVLDMNDVKNGQKILVNNDPCIITETEYVKPGKGQAFTRMQAVLDADERIVDFQVRAAHLESLHPHDAVAVASKGVPGGYDALAS